MIKSVKLIKTFGSKTVLGPISLDLKGRGILGLLGPDGAGKTTLLSRSSQTFLGQSPMIAGFIGNNR